MKNSDAARIERERDVVAGLEAGRLDRLDAEVERRLRRGQVGREAALVADVGVVSRLLQRGLERVERLRAPAHRLGERRRADRQDHELLKVDRIVGMDAAIDDVHLRRRQDPGHRSADVAIKRQARSLRRRLGDGERDAEDRVGAELRLVLRAVERDHRLVDLELVLGLEARDGVENLAIDRLDRLENALAAEAALVAVAQLDRLARSRRRAGRNRGPAHRAVFQNDIHLDRRIAPAVENFAGDDVHDRGHFASIAEASARVLTSSRGTMKGGRDRQYDGRAHSTFAFAAAQLTKMDQARKNMHGRAAEARDTARNLD